MNDVDRHDLEALKELMEAKFASVEAVLAERDKALLTALTDLNRRLDELNRLREEVNEDRGLYLTKEKYDGEHGVLEERVNSLETWRGKAALVMGGVAILSGLIGAAIMRLVAGAVGT